MKDENDIPWWQILCFLFLLILGMSVPFWTEYRRRARSRPAAATAPLSLKTLEE